MSDSDEKTLFRVTKINIRCNRAIAAFQHVRAEIEVSVLKGGDHKAARDFAVEECHKAINQLAHKEKRPSLVLDPIEDKLPDIEEKDPF